MPPNFSIAWRRASTGDRPERRFSSVCKAMCSVISSRKRSSWAWRAAELNTRVRKRLRDFMTHPGLSGGGSFWFPTGRKDCIVPLGKQQVGLRGWSEFRERYRSPENGGNDIGQKQSVMIFPINLRALPGTGEEGIFWVVVCRRA